MTARISIVYIGEKPQKLDTVTGSRLVFPRHTPVEVESALAYRLLAFPDVFVRADLAETVLEQQARAREQAALLARQTQEAADAAREADSFVVMTATGEMDISKFTSVKLATLCESEGLALTQEQTEKVDTFRRRVRDALKRRGEPDDQTE